MKGKVICIKLHDGSTQLAVVLKRNGNTLTVKAYDGNLYDVNSDDLHGIHYVFSDSVFNR